jgi:hypothetical protein
MELTLPHKFRPREYQLPFLRAWDSGVKRFILVWHRRSGKDKTVFSSVPKKMFERVGTYFYFLPTYTQAKKVIWDGIDKDGFRFLDHIPQELIKNINATDMKVELVNGSIVQLIGAENIDRIVGTNPIGVVFSEYSLMRPQVWDFIRPILAENGGWAVFIFTPRGMNHAWKLLQQAKDDTVNWFWQVLTVNDTSVLSEDTLVQERKEMPQDLFEQEYYCKFIEGAGAFFRRISENVKLTDPKPDPSHKYRMGVDLAKYQDYTVLTVLDLMTFEVVHIDRFNQIDWNLQKAKIEALYLRYFKPQMTMDSTGLGDPIYDDLVNRGMKNVISYKFTEGSRKDLLTNLQLLLEQNRIKIPEDETLIEELRSMRYELIGERGKTAIRVPEGLHDDMIMSLALACWELPQNPLPRPGSLMFLNKNELVTQTSYE